MRRSLHATLAITAVSAAALVVPLVADAAGSPVPPACAASQGAVTTARAKVDRDTRALARAGKAERRDLSAVRTARKKLRRAQTSLSAAQDALTTCAVANQPRPTATATATVTATPVTTGATPAALTFTQGTARLTEVRPDLSPVPPIGSWDGVPLGGTGFGSAWTADPRNPGWFYGLTDRGPNVTAPDGISKLEPMAGFQDAIGWFHQVGGTLQLVRTIGLTLPNGTPMSGLVNTEASTGEKILDQYGNTLPSAASGFDPEGLVALPDGTFWVSDEYGPFIVHVDADGKELERYDPYVTSTGTSPVFGSTVHPLPAELRKRRPNRGMEGLTVTSDGKFLVGVVQSPLEANGSSKPASSKGAVIRIVKVSLADHAVQEYLYTMHAAAGNAVGEAVSEITAVPGSNTQFVLDERDGKFEGTAGGAVKNLYKIDLASATDVGPSSPLVNGTTVTYDGASGTGTGLLLNGRTIEEVAGAQSPADATTALAAAGITIGAESTYLRYSALLTAIDPSGMYFGHDKVEGVSFDPTDPHRLYIANDSDFGITDLPRGENPDPAKGGDTRARGINAIKLLPDGKTQDFGEVLVVDMTQVAAQYTS